MMRRRNGRVDAGRRFFFYEIVFAGTTPPPIERGAKPDDIEPVNYQRRTIGDERGQQLGGEWDERDHKKEGEMNPGQGAVRVFELADLRVLSDPKNAERHKAE